MDNKYGGKKGEAKNTRELMEWKKYCILCHRALIHCINYIKTKNRLVVGNEPEGGGRGDKEGNGKADTNKAH